MMTEHRTDAAHITADQQAVEDDLVATVVTSFDDTPDPRLKQLMQAVVRHLHAFIREVRLTEQEWNRAIEFLTAVGNITDDKRQEFVLLSDVLGASMQTIAVNNQAHANATEATVFGPYFVADSPQIPLGGDIGGGAPGSRVGSRAPSPTPTAAPSPAPRSRSGRRTRTACTTCNTPTAGSPAALISLPTTTAPTGSGD